MKKSLAALLPGLLFVSLFSSLLTLSTGCLVRPIGYAPYRPHHHHGGYRRW